MVVGNVWNYKRSIETIIIWGLFGSGGHFYPKLKKRWPGKLHRTILLHFGLVNIDYHFPKIGKSIMCMVFGPSGHDHDPPNSLFLNFESV